MENSAERTQEAPVKREEDGRVWIPTFRGFGSGEFCSSVHGAQYTAMRTIGAPITYEQLLGASGMAFRIQAHDEMCPSSPHSCCGRMCVDGAIKALPWKARAFHFFKPEAKEPGRKERETEMRAVVRASIDRGVPVQYGSCEDGNIVGYLDGGAKWLCVHPYYKDGREMFVFGESGQAFPDCGGDLPWGVTVFTDPKAEEETAPRRDLALHAMKQAVEMWHEDKQEAYFMGERAWEHWLGWLKSVDTAKPDDVRGGMQGNFWIYATLFEYRIAAATWLRECQEDFEQPVREHMFAAANHYTQLAAALLDGEECVWKSAPPRGKPQDWAPERRHRQTAALEKALAHDRAAIAALERALAGLESR